MPKKEQERGLQILKVKTQVYEIMESFGENIGPRVFQINFAYFQSSKLDPN